MHIFSRNRPLTAFAIFWSLFLFFTGTPSHAFVTLECDNQKVRWRNIDFQSEAIRLRMAAISFPEQSAWTEMLTSAVSIWNRQPTEGRFILSRDREVALDNGQNEVWMTDSEDILDYSDGVAITQYAWDNCENIVETDIAFRANGNLSTSRSPNELTAYQGLGRFFETVALHELGHALGLDHNGSFMNIMGYEANHLQTNGQQVTGHVGQDAAAGAAYLYGLSPQALPDLSIHHVKFLGPPGLHEYAPHIGTETSSPERFGRNVRIGNERLVTVHQGQELDLEFTPDHNDTGHFETTIAIYASGDRTITPQDTRLLSRNYSILRGFFPRPESFRIRIPKELPPGDYYLGAIIDPENRIQEVYETNNATFALFSDQEILRVRVESPLPPSDHSQAGTPIGTSIGSFYNEHGELQLRYFPELRATQQGFPSFPTLTCQMRFKLYRNNIQEAVHLTAPAFPGTIHRWIPSNVRGTLASGAYRWSAETVCDNQRISSPPRQLPLIEGRHFDVRVPLPLPSVPWGVLPTPPSQLLAVAYPQPGTLPLLYLAGESFDRNGDALDFRFHIRLIPGTTRSPQIALVQALLQGRSIFVGPILPPQLGASTLAAGASTLIPSNALVDGRYQWELCVKDLAQRWQCTPGREVEVRR